MSAPMSTYTYMFWQKVFFLTYGTFLGLADQKRPGWDSLMDPPPKNSYFDVHYT